MSSATPEEVCSSRTCIPGVFVMAKRKYKGRAEEARGGGRHTITKRCWQQGAERGWQYIRSNSLGSAL